MIRKGASRHVGQIRARQQAAKGSDLADFHHFILHLSRVGCYECYNKFYLILYLLDLLHDALHAVPGGGDEDGDREGEGNGDRDREGGVVHLAGGGHVDGHGHRDGGGLCQTLRLGGLVAGVGPTANTLKHTQPLLPNLIP